MHGIILMQTKVLDVASLVRLVPRVMFVASQVGLGLIGAWQVEGKRDKVPYCFSAVDSCCYATDRLSLSPGCTTFVFPAHTSARSFHTFTGGSGCDFLEDCSMK